MSNLGPSSKVKKVKAASTLIEAPKKKAKHKKKTELQIDPNWKSSAIKRTSFNAFGGSVSSLIGIASSPAKKTKIVTERTTDLDGASSQNEDLFQFQSPDKGIKSQALHFLDSDERLARSRTVSTHIGKISHFHSEEKVDRTRIDIPVKIENMDNLLDDKGLPKSDVSSMVDAMITLSSLKVIEKIKRDRVNTSKRQPTNKAVTKVPADQVAKLLGLDGVDWQWWHLIGHALFGDKAQNFDNFVLGKKHGNAIMNDIAESVVLSILQDKLCSDTLYLSVHVSFVEGFERARLANRVTWVLKDAPGDTYTKIVKFDFDPLAIETLSESEVNKFKSLLPTLFYQGNEAIQLLTPTKPLMPLDMQSPSPLVMKKSPLSKAFLEVSPSPLLYSPKKAKSDGPALLVSTEKAMPLLKLKKPSF